MWQTIGHTMMRVSNRVNLALSVRAAEWLGLYYVSEYPKSGGTWLSRMLADALGVPKPMRSIFPIGEAAVVQNHWGFDARRAGRSVYLYRDGRDVMVSHYFHLVRRTRDEQLADGQRRQAQKRLESLFGEGYDPDDSRTNLPAFLRYRLHETDSRAGPLGRTWAEHVRDWQSTAAQEQVVYVSYEELLRDAAGQLARVSESLTGREVPGWRIEMAVEKFSIERQTGRRAGQEDRSHFIRKGVAGDWVHHFSRESAEIFDRAAGDTLIELGYEQDRSWVARVAR